jgi:hypothetical protein
MAVSKIYKYTDWSEINSKIRNKLPFSVFFLVRGNAFAAPFEPHRSCF